MNFTIIGTFQRHLVKFWSIIIAGQVSAIAYFFLLLFPGFENIRFEGYC